MSLQSTIVLLAFIALTLLIGYAEAFANHRGVFMRLSSVDLRTKSSKSTGVKSFNQIASSPEPTTSTASSNLQELHESRKQEWINRSVTYYTKVMREERRRRLGQTSTFSKPEQQEEFINLAKKHYFARYKIKSGMPQHAEQIYRRIINDLISEEEGQCDFAKLAVTTLLLALLLQRLGDTKGTRSVFLNFFRLAVLDMEDGQECACSAKVLQAYALFEMKRGNPLKSLEIVTKAVKLDQSLAPVLQWKQFRDALDRMSHNHEERGGMLEMI
jgi:hypothetical protein